MELGNKLKDARTKASLSQDALAKRIGVSRQTISNWENGRSYPDIGSLLKLSDLYGLSLDEMLKEDEHIQEHFENIAAKRRNFWQLVLEVGVVLDIMGWLLIRQEFLTIGPILAVSGVVLGYAGLIMLLRVFDHSRQEIIFGFAGLAIAFGGMVLILLIPELARNGLFSLLRLVGIGMLWYSGVWESTWKSPRLWLLILLYVSVPLFSIATNLQDTGSLNENSPFLFEYRIEEVLYPENQENWERKKIHLQLILSEHRLQIAENGEDYETIGVFTYIPASPERNETGVWQLIPEDAPERMYKVTVDTDGQVFLSCSENEQLQFKWLLSRVDTANVGVSTFGKVMSTSPNWYPAGSDDPEPYFRESDVLKNAKMTITVGGLDTQTLTLVEEYHHGDAVEYQTYTLQPTESGSFYLPLTTRYKDEQQYALYRIPFDGGEYRFILTFG